MTMAGVTFSRAADFLAERLDSAPGAKRLGLVLRAAGGGLDDVAEHLSRLVNAAPERLARAFERELADLREDSQRAAMRFNYAGSVRLPASEQISLLEQHRGSQAVTIAAARQPSVPVEVQRFLSRECVDHEGAMTALARRPDADLLALEPLASHPSKRVRQALAESLGPRMRISEPRLHDAKDALYNALLNHFEGDFAPHLVPVCRDGEQLERMYEATAKSPASARLFVENPFAPDRVLRNISTSATLKLIPGGSGVANEAKKQLEKRLNADDEATPQPY